MAVRDKILTLQSEMNDFLKERKDLVLAMFLALLTRQHVVLFGPRGTAKSIAVRLLAGQVDGSRYWERLFTRFTVPEEVFGPVKVSALKNDSFERQTVGHLPWAVFAFADEIFKANSSILNSLLTVINERLFHNDGAPMEVPLETLVGASNELPSDESLSALYDRFLLRVVVKYIAEDAAFLAMLNGSRSPTLATRLTLDEIHAAQDEVAHVAVPAPVMEALASIRRSLAQQGIQPSDRRYKQSVDVVRAKAWIMGRAEVVLDDLGVLTHVLWDDPNQRSLVQGIVLEVSNPLLQKAEQLFDAVQVTWAELQKETDDQKRTAKAVEVLNKINEALGSSQKPGARMKPSFPKLIEQGKAMGADMSAVEGFVVQTEQVKTRIHKDYLNL